MLEKLRKERGDEGFTLIELLVVIIIIGILAAIAIPVFLNQRAKGWDAAVKADLRNAATAQETYLTETGVYSAETPIDRQRHRGAGSWSDSSTRPRTNYDGDTATIVGRRRHQPVLLPDRAVRFRQELGVLEPRWPAGGRLHPDLSQ